MKRRPLLSPFKHNDQPVLSNLPGIDKHFVLVFTTEEKLHSGMIDMQYGGSYKIKQVTDINEFLGSLREQGVRVMLDPYIVDGEKTRWIELVEESDIERLKNDPQYRKEAQRIWHF
jgi:hypothetical protein